MKEIKKEKIYKYSVYVASDGTEFDDPKECKIYEESAVGVLFSRLKSIAITTINGGECDFMDENEENSYITVVPECQRNIDLINQLLDIKQNSDSYRLNDSDVNKAILIGYRMHNNKLDWIWFYRVDNLIEKILSDKFKYQYKLKSDA